MYNMRAIVVRVRMRVSRTVRGPHNTFFSRYFGINYGMKYERNARGIFNRIRVEQSVDTINSKRYSSAQYYVR